MYTWTLGWANYVHLWSLHSFKLIGCFWNMRKSRIISINVVVSLTQNAQGKWLTTARRYWYNPISDGNGELKAQDSGLKIQISAFWGIKNDWINSLFRFEKSFINLKMNSLQKTAKVVVRMNSTTQNIAHLCLYPCINVSVLA